jgi:hypothetical protein
VDHVSDEDLQEAAHYAKYAFAAYGYLLYIWSKPQHKYGPHQVPDSSFAFSLRRSAACCMLCGWSSTCREVAV